MQLTTRYKLDTRPEYARAILNWNNESKDNIPEAFITDNQISSKLLNCKNADALLILPGKTKEIDEVKKGDVVEAMLLGSHQNTF